jgi:hypothetical protein
VGAASPPRGRHVQAARKPLSGWHFPADSGPFLHCFVPIRAAASLSIADPPDQGRLAERECEPSPARTRRLLRFLLSHPFQAGVSLHVRAAVAVVLVARSIDCLTLAARSADRSTAVREIVALGRLRVRRNLPATTARLSARLVSQNRRPAWIGSRPNSNDRMRWRARHEPEIARR